MTDNFHFAVDLRSTHCGRLSALDTIQMLKLTIRKEGVSVNKGTALLSIALHVKIWHYSAQYLKFMLISITHG
jgi:hypothetical protein